jgi:3-oxoacyl-[acyl-carrier-protein] synthase II
MTGPLDDSGPAYRRSMAGGRFDFDLWGPEGMPEIFPLSFLRVLPNMIASHISIVHDARGPNNTIHQAEVSGLLAVSEAVRVIQRGAADVMLAGAASSMMHPFDWVAHCGLGRLSTRQGDPARILCPFDARRDGEVRGEGGAVFILESRQHAEARGVEILARVLGCSSACEVVNGRGLVHGTGLRRAMHLALQEGGLKPNEVGHVNAHGVSTVADDALEARAIHDVLPGVPVTAPKSLFGNLGAAGGVVEMVASVLALVKGKVPATRNYEQPDPECPIPVISGGPQEIPNRTAVSVNFTGAGQAVAVVLGGAD